MTENLPLPNSIKKILVIGSWAKEQITIENIKNNPSLQVFSYLDTKNPGIISLADKYKIGDLHDIDRILSFAKSMQVDLVIITTACPLSLGIVDVLERENIPVFGPKKSAARLESDKAFTRKLLKKYGMEVLPEFKVFNKYEEAVSFAKKLNWNVAVKPVGLTEGLGVKVFGEQLKNSQDIINYINQILNNKIGGVSKVLIEEKLEGEEFTIQCFVYGNIIIPTPAVQDFKRLLPQDKGPNTASMGSYSDVGKLLPFMEEEDYISSIDIIKETLQAYRKETGEICCGFLYGQFMLTKQGVKLIEYNFRPGDPEWMNVVYILKDNVIDIILGLFKKEQRGLCFEPKSTVCKYIVSQQYPEKLNQVLDISFPKDRIRKLGVDFYYSCGMDSENKLNVGSERGIAFIAKADTIFEAHQKVEQAISLVEGNFHYRNDIGSKKMIKSKEFQVNQRLRKK